MQATPTTAAKSLTEVSNGSCCPDDDNDGRRRKEPLAETKPGLSCLSSSLLANARSIKTNDTAVKTVFERLSAIVGESVQVARTAVADAVITIRSRFEAFKEKACGAACPLSPPLACAALD